MKKIPQYLRLLYSMIFHYDDLNQKQIHKIIIEKLSRLSQNTLDNRNNYFLGNLQISGKNFLGEIYSDVPNRDNSQKIGEFRGLIKTQSLEFTLKIQNDSLINISNFSTPY